MLDGLSENLCEDPSDLTNRGRISLYPPEQTGGAVVKYVRQTLIWL